MATARNLGLRDIYYALVTKNTATEYTCSAPKKLSRGVKAKVEVKKSAEKLYSDSAEEDTIYGTPEISVELGIDNLTMQQQADLFGAKVEKGVLIETSDDIPNDVALMFRNKRPDGKYQFQCLFVGKLGEEDSFEVETDTDKPSHTTKTLKGSFRGRELDRQTRIIVKEDELVSGSDEDAQTIITNWFSKVPQQTAAL